MKKSLKKCTTLLLVVGIAITISGCGCQRETSETKPSTSPSTSVTPSVTAEATVQPSPSPSAEPTVPVVPADGLTSDQVTSMKDDANSLYTAAFNGDYDAIKGYLSDTAKSTFETVQSNNGSQVTSDGMELLYNLKNYTDVSSPIKTGEPAEYGGESEYIVTLLLKDDYTARVGFITDASGKYVVNTYSMQSLSMGEGGVMGSGQ